MKTSLWHFLTALMIVLANPFVVAQETEQTGQSIEEVIVYGIRGSLARSLDQKRNADGVIDGITAEDIADFPDLNISEALQRITGVTINRVLGEGQRVSVRGLAPEFTRVTINGQTVTSGEPGREVDFDVFASELFTNVQLTKSPNASLTEGGLAATVDLRTARPFDFAAGAPVLSLSGQLSKNEMRDENDPRFSFLASNTFSDGTVGLLASVSYSESSLRQDNAEGQRFLLTDIDVEGDGVNEFDDVEIPFIPRYILELLDRERLGITGAIQLKPNDDFEFNFDIAYAEFEEVRGRHSIDGFLRGNRTMPVALPTVDSTSLVTQATYDGVSSRSENILTPSEEELILLNADAAWKLNEEWELRVKAGFSEAEKSSREFRSVWQAIDTFSFDFTDRIFVGISSENTDYTNPADFSANQSRYLWNDVTDEELSFQMDAERVLPGPFSSIEFGVRYNDGEKTNRRRDGRISFATGTVSPSSSVARDLPVSDFFDQEDAPQIVRNWFVTDFDAVFSDSVLTPDTFIPPERYISNFNIEEETFAAYIQLNIDTQIGKIPVRGNIGVRTIDTDQTSSGFIADGTPVSQSQNYAETLPSLNLAVELSDDFLLRFTASKSLTRPTLTALSPGGTIAPTGLTANLGNPGLAPFTADQFDIALEWYFAQESLVSIVYFDKNVDGFITNVGAESMVNGGTLINDDGEDVSNAIFLVTQPVNGETASITGYEISIQAPFTFLPSPFDGFGTLLNYTEVDSESTIQFNNMTVTTLLPGQSESSYNAILYYEKDDFSGRLAYSWRDEYLDQLRPSQRQRSNFIDEYGQMDLSLQYAYKDITFTFDALNLLEEEEHRFGERKDRSVRYTEWGRFFLLGIRYKF